MRKHPTKNNHTETPNKKHSTKNVHTETPNKKHPTKNIHVDPHVVHFRQNEPHEKCRAHT